MITLNLIPPEKKEELKLAQLYVVIKNLVILILLIAIMVSIVLLVTKITLQNHFNRIVEQSTLTTRYATTFGQEVKELNLRVNAVAQIQAEHISWTEFLISLSNLTPGDIYFSNLTVKEAKLLLNGSAETRNHLLEFQESLENSDLFSNVEIPLDNLLKREDIDFTLKADVNLELL